MSAYPAARLLHSAAMSDQFPPDRGVEVAVAGRSNAGKSSAINAICGRRALARTSKSPGRTRLVNFFELAEGRRLIDLPGYGYARGPVAQRLAWKRLIEALAVRRCLAGLLLVVDVRRGLLPADLQLLGWAAALAHPVHVLLAKADQCTRASSASALATAEGDLQGRATVQLFSAHRGLGVEQARLQLERWLRIRGPQAAGKSDVERDGRP